MFIYYIAEPRKNRTYSLWRSTFCFLTWQTQATTHLHIRDLGRPNQRYPILFRDYLRAHPMASAAYAQIKTNLSRRHPDDVEFYYDIKDPLCDIVIDAAEDWARATNWQMGPSDI